MSSKHLSTRLKLSWLAGGMLLGLLPLLVAANLPQASSVVQYGGQQAGQGAVSFNVGAMSCTIPFQAIPGSSGSTGGVCLCIGGGGSNQAGSGTAANKYEPLYVGGATGATAQYFVPAGLNFYVTDLYATASQNTAGASFAIGYGAQLSSEDQTTTPANVFNFMSAPTGTSGATGMDGPFVLSIASSYSTTHWGLPIGTVPGGASGGSSYLWFRTGSGYSAGSFYLIECGILGK